MAQAVWKIQYVSKWLFSRALMTGEAGGCRCLLQADVYVRLMFLPTN